MTHMDTVPLCAGAKPKRQGKKIVNTAKTALGGDNRTGLRRARDAGRRAVCGTSPHPPLTLLFTVREESGLWGARHVDPADLGGVTMGFNFDGRIGGRRRHRRGRRRPLGGRRSSAGRRTPAARRSAASARP